MTSAEPAEKHEARKKRAWPRFGLRFLLAIVTLAAIALGVWQFLFQPYLFEARQAVLWRNDGAVVEVMPAGQAWARSLVGKENLAQIQMVDLREIEVTAETITTLEALREIQTLIARADHLNTADINRLASISSLKLLVLDSTPLTAVELAPLQQRHSDLGIMVIERHALAVLSAAEFEFLGSTVIDPLGAVSPTQLIATDGTLSPEELEPVYVAKIEVPAKATVDYDELALALKCLHHVQSVSLKGPQCAARLLPAIDGWLYVETLTVSGARGNQPIGLRHLQSHPGLRRLYLEDVELDGPDLVALASLHQLEDLHLEKVSMVPEYLSEIVQLENLKSLRLPASLVSRDNYTQLSQLESLRFLQVLGSITPDRKLELSTLLPDCTLVARGEAEIDKARFDEPPTELTNK